ncbi:zinc metalloprotease [Polaribacter sp. WD7]|nr:zinc metalloprotease [uncultured Polaribacter sp.]RCS26112.1 zinc metalloprotease [Polaribacter sp. WD7]
MKKGLVALLLTATTFIGCQNNGTDIPNDEQSKVDMSDFFLYTDQYESKGNNSQCHTMNVLNQKLKTNKGLYQKMYEIEYATRQFIAAKKGGGGGRPGSGNGGGDTGDSGDNLGVINIPVYVHVVYSNSNENISDAQVASQIKVLNDDFRRANSDANNTPNEFASVAADSEITFTLANTFRHPNSRTSWGTNDAVKGSYPPITPSTHLNIWVANIGGGILGYAQFPGGSPSTDGIVVSPQYFGTTGFVAAPFDGGRTTTHEVGHYLNLRHIWGDGRCNRDDFVSDTPSSDRPNYGCPTSANHCRSNDQFMNYMDYTDDSCMNMFSEGQKSRMRSILVAGGARASLAGN